MDLILDPNDGRETGLDQPLRQFRPEDIVVDAPDPYAQLLNDHVRRVLDDYAGKVNARAAELAELGFALEEVDRKVISDPVDLSSDSMRMRIQGTYRIVRAPD